MATPTAHRTRNRVLIGVAIIATLLAIHRVAIELSVRANPVVQDMTTLAEANGWEPVWTDTTRRWGLPLFIAGISDTPIERTVVYRTDTDQATAGRLIADNILEQSWPTSRDLEWRTLEAASATGRAVTEGVLPDSGIQDAVSLIGYNETGWVDRLHSARIEVSDGAVAITTLGGQRRSLHNLPGNEQPPTGGA